ncbi:TlpA disulfide reductase family protein [Acerihabitans sp. TG2]|uniref:TlpA family protein disulfide reductase n=1 Tax=Acerihabitans sp. TG2 TaxID=3096008 RepID=UPI002B22A279|nr:TlpA disulfide reductase family protein [Acerihabitans sp. TG2]MEA9389167.1 TlpA disulfide reductase family protein [Acerihabitans sp. TG2]
MNWRHRVKTIGLLIMLTGLLGCKEQRVAIGAPAPALAAFDLNGQPAGLEKWHGKAVYLTFWSADCGGCAADMRTLQQLSDTYGDRLVVVAVNTDPQQTDLTRFISGLHIRYPVVRDQMGITKERYAVIGTPTSYLLNPQGQVLEIHQGLRGETALAAMFKHAQQDKS